MKIRVWGCRGSLTTPGSETVRYGGHTTCVEVRSAQGQLIILDAGSGLRRLGKALLAEPGLTKLTFLFTHSHWDHLTGFPFFTPAYLPQYSITLGGGPVAQASLKSSLTHQMEAPYFPVDFSFMKANFHYGCHCPHCPQDHQVGGLDCRAIALNHPNGGYGFRLTERGKSFVFLTDNELGFAHRGGLPREDYLDFCRGADLLFHDAQYTDAEYRHTRGWGHSTYADATELAMAAGVKRFGLFHHDPDRTDDELDRQLEACRKHIEQAGSTVNCFAAAEEQVLEI